MLSHAACLYSTARGSTRCMQNSPCPSAALYILRVSLDMMVLVATIIHLQLYQRK